jgi:hypothetical protein
MPGIEVTLTYILLEFQKAVKQKAAKPIVEYFQRVCDATIMHVVFFCARTIGKRIDPISCGGRIFRLKFRNVKAISDILDISGI